MLGLMQDWPLLCHRIIDHAAMNHAGRAIVTRSLEGAIHETTYADIRARALRLAQRLERDGIGLGDRVATLAWNTWRHLEAWYGIMGIGAVYHTVNPRLFPDQIVWIVNHAEDRVMLADLTFIPLLEKLADKLPTIERYVVLTDAAHMPQTVLRNAVPYEEWIAEADGDFAWKSVRRKYRRRHVLHLGHDRKPERRALFAPLERVARADGGHLRHERVFVARRGDAGRAHVPCQLLGDGVRRSDCRRFPGDARRQARRRVGVRTARPLQGHLHRRGADGLAHAAATPRSNRQQAAPSPESHHWRLRVSARHSQDLPGRLRGRGDSRLGHDRDEPARHRVHAQARICRTRRRCAARHSAETGSIAVHGRNEDHRRCRQAAALGRQDLRPVEGARTGGRQSLLQGGRLHPRRGGLLRHRRCFDHRSPRLYAGHRPRQGRHQIRAANGSRRSIWRTSPSATPKWRKRPSSA